MTLRSARILLQQTLPRAFRLRLLALLCLFISVLTFARDAVAQTTDASPEDVVRVETNLITVPVYVDDARRRRVQQLTAADFQIRDAGRPVELAYFAAGTQRVALTFLLDASGSTRERITQQRETALALFARFGEGSRVAVIRFWEQPDVTAPFTSERERIREAFQLPALPDRRTAIFDAALAAVRHFDSLRSERTERRIVILISDGLDTASTTRARQVVEEATAGGISFYVVHLPLFAPRGVVLAPRPYAKGFRDLAAQTGGRFFTLGDAASALDPRARYDLAPIFQAVAEDLQSQYVLGFYADNSTARDRRPRRIDVTLTADAKRKLRVHVLRASYQLQ
jgi:VWFA-related protein